MEEYPDFTTVAERDQLAQLEGELDWHYRAGAGLERLRGRLRNERRAKPQAAVLRRLAAVAALLLVTLGLFLPFQGNKPTGTTLDGVFAELHDSRDIATGTRKLAHEMAVPAARNDRMRVTWTLPAENFDKDQNQMRQQLRASLPRLPDGPAVPLSLVIVNQRQQPITLHFGDERTQLTLDLRGRDTLTLLGNQTVSGRTPEFLKRRDVFVPPGKHHVLEIPHLVGGGSGQLRSVYWLAPGSYMLSAMLRVRLSEQGQLHEIHVRTEPVTIEVTSP